MQKFFAEKLNIAVDGSWQASEIIAALIAVVVIVLLFFAAFKIIGVIANRINPRKSTIFSHRKNQYKDRIGKKTKF